MADADAEQVQFSVQYGLQWKAKLSIFPSQAISVFLPPIDIFYAIFSIFSFSFLCFSYLFYASIACGNDYDIFGIAKNTFLDNRKSNSTN